MVLIPKEPGAALKREFCSVTEIDGCLLLMSQTAEVERSFHVSCVSTTLAV